MLTFEITYFTVWTTHSWNFSSLSSRSTQAFYTALRRHTLISSCRLMNHICCVYIYTYIYLYCNILTWKEHLQADANFVSMLVYFNNKYNTCLQYPLSSPWSMKSFYKPTFLPGIKNQLLLQNLPNIWLSHMLLRLPKNILYYIS